MLSPSASPAPMAAAPRAPSSRRRRATARPSPQPKCALPRARRKPPRASRFRPPRWRVWRGSMSPAVPARARSGSGIRWTVHGGSDLLTRAPPPSRSCPTCTISTRRWSLSLPSPPAISKRLWPPRRMPSSSPMLARYLLKTPPALRPGWRAAALIRFAGPRLPRRATTCCPSRCAAPRAPLAARLPGKSRRGSPSSLRRPLFGLPVPEDIRVRQQVLASPDPELSRKTWARLADGSPLVTASARGSGMLILFHVTMARLADLAYSGLFEQMLRRCDHGRARRGNRRHRRHLHAAAHSRRFRPPHQREPERRANQGDRVCRDTPLRNPPARPLSRPRRYARAECRGGRKARTYPRMAASCAPAGRRRSALAAPRRPAARPCRRSPRAGPVCRAACRRPAKVAAEDVRHGRAADQWADNPHAHPAAASPRAIQLRTDAGWQLSHVDHIAPRRAAAGQHGAAEAGRGGPADAVRLCRNQ